jgi:glycine/D-amino acid oxidase-like deaminating enzyme
MLGPATGELIARVVLGRPTADDAATMAALAPERPFGGGSERLR